MLIPSAIQTRYEYHLPYVDWVASHVRETLLSYAERRGYAFAGRIKDGGSLAEKIETGRYAAWADLDDHYACSLVIPSLTEEQEVLDYLPGVFEVVQIRRRATTLKDPSVFRFDSTRVIARVRAASDRAEELLAVQFEIQVRTAFEHAWSAATHKLAYKGNRIDWRRLRLAAQLRASVEQLDLLVAGYEGVADLIPSQHWPEIDVKTQVEAYFRTALETKSIPSVASPQSWVRFCDNTYNLVRSFATERQAKEKTVWRELERAVARQLEAQSFPLSISLFQFVLAAAANLEGAGRALSRHHALVTEQLSELFPEVRHLPAQFRL